MCKKLVCLSSLFLLLTLTGQVYAVDDVANSDIPVQGNVSGSYVDTQSSDDSYESITEILSGGKPSNRYSYLEHKWLINVTGGSTVTFNIEAYHTANGEGDDFVFAYSTTGVDGTYTDMVTVTKTSDDDQVQSYALPSSTSGNVYIRVKDTDQTAGSQNLDSIYVDHMYIESTTIATPGVTITESGGSTDVDEAGPTLDTYTVVLDTQPTDTVTITVDPDIQTEVNNNGAGNSVQLTFLTTNWDTAQTVTVTAIDDSDVEGTHTSTITHAPASSDSSYDSLGIANVVANVTDNDGSADTIDLSGQWRYDLDPTDIGVSPGQWYNNTLSGTGFNLPGTTSDNLIGDDYWNTYTVPAAPDAMWRFLQRHLYVGPAWYQRTIDIPSDWNGQRVTLFLERIIWQSRVWIDDTEVGAAQNSLVAPHLYDLTSYVTPGSSHTLTIRIDNSHQGADNEVGQPHAYTDQTQTIWNGIIGKIELAVTDKLWIDDVQIIPDVTNKTARIKVKTGNTTGSSQSVTLTVSAQSFNSAQSHTPASDIFSYTCPAGGGEDSFDYTIGEGMLTWNEFDPSLYHFTVNVSGGGYSDEKIVDAGMRQIAVNGTQFTINGDKIFLRGTIDCSINPLTGYPPMDLTSWLDIMQIVKDYGFNHVRYHSWTPPKAAFEAADRLGLYLQTEGPVWGSIDSTNYDYLLAEATRIVNTYGNSPSFTMFSNGNELSGGYTLWSDILLSLKSLDTSSRHVYTVMAGWGSVAQPGEDYKCMLDSPTANYLRASYGHFGYAGEGATLYVPGLGSDTIFDWSVGKSEVSIPIVSHEVGQYVVFPNTDEIPKYNGVLRPVNYEAVKVALEQKGLLPYVSDYVAASGKLALLLYKAELEAALRTDGFGGFQMLQLTDFPGQSTATVGILDALWDSKGICTPADFKEFCSETVPLANMSKYVWENNETFTANVELAHFGPNPLTDAAFQWAIKDGVQTVFSGTFATQTISNGNGIALGSINQDLSSITSAKELTLSVWLPSTSILNEWNIYVYPVTPPVSEETLLAQGNIMVSSVYGAAEQAHLDSGGNVLIVTETAALKAPIRGSFFPIFWAPPVEANGGWPNRPCGIFLDKNHGIFDEFPTDNYSNFQWYEPLENSAGFVMDNLPASIEPIVNLVPDFYYSKKLGNLIEANVSNGKLVICSMDIDTNLSTRPAARQLRYSILSYMAGTFNPSQSLTQTEVEMIVGAQSNYVENPGFENGLSGWTTDNPSAAYTQSFPYEGAFNLANWSASPYQVTTYQTLTGLENGTYTLKVMAYSNGGQTDCYIFARNYGGSELTADLPVSGAYVEVEISNIVVTNGQCEIGVYSNASADEWCRLDNFSFTGDGGGDPLQTITVDSATATNEAPGYEASMAIDGNTSTMWHTNWDPMPTPALPQSITLDLAGSDLHDVTQLKYLPRQDANYNGVITGYTIYTSTNGVDFNQVASGTWALDFAEKTATWSSTNATHVKLTVTAGWADFVSAAEFVIQGPTASGCTPADMHIEAVTCAEVSCGGPNKNGQAIVTIYDDCGNPVSNALVDGTFGGAFNETIYDVATDANGQAVLITTGCLKRPSFTFTVDDVAHGTLPYDSNDDLVTGCSG